MHFFHARAGYGLCLALFLPLFANASPVPTGKPTAYPDWWFEQDVIARVPAQAANNNPAWPTHYPAADDFAVVNIGQLKYIAAKAAAEMNASFPSPGAGSAINTMVSAWTAAPASGVTRDDFAALNLGQLKTIAEPFHARLYALGYGMTFGTGQIRPWTISGSDDDNYSLVNLGQLKLAFSFQIPAGGEDTDADGISDAWETTQFGSLTAQSGSGNAESPAPDSLSNKAESLAGTNPNVAADESATAIAALGLIVYSP